MRLKKWEKWADVPKQKVTVLLKSDPKKWPFGVRKILKINTLKVVIWKSHSVTGHFSINFSRKKRMLMYKLLIINILYTSSFFLTLKSKCKWPVTEWPFSSEIRLIIIWNYKGILWIKKVENLSRMNVFTRLLIMW